MDSKSVLPAKNKSIGCLATECPFTFGSTSRTSILEESHYQNCSLFIHLVREEFSVIFRIIKFIIASLEKSIVNQKAIPMDCALESLNLENGTLLGSNKKEKNLLEVVRWFSDWTKINFPSAWHPIRLVLENEWKWFFSIKFIVVHLLFVWSLSKCLIHFLMPWIKTRTLLIW